MKSIVFSFSAVVFLLACSPSKQLAKTAQQSFLKQNATAHTGISIYEPATNKYWYNYQADKYFVPASNVKIATCYAALKHLGNRLKGIKYEEHENTITIEATGDPTLLHPDFPNQPVFELLRQKRHILINTENWAEQGLGKGWSWDDYNDDYMAERSPLPVYGNLAHFTKDLVLPTLFRDSVLKDADSGTITDAFILQRKNGNNTFWMKPAEKKFSTQEIPFVTNGFEATKKLLKDTLKNDIRTSFYTMQHPRIIYTQPTDSVLKPMMHRSDNFLAEQMLLMVSNELLGVMNDAQIIDTLLQTDLKDLPQKPRWVDGSGLSRYNLFSPKDFVYLLNKMKTEFGIERMQNILPTGNSGTLSNYYRADSGYIFAKTGSMSGVVSLCGYLHTKKNKLLIFSVLVNNNQPFATEVRRSIEKFLESIRNKY